MNEPFLPLPLPSAPEDGIGPALASALGFLSRTTRALVRWFRRIDIREPLSRGEFHPRLPVERAGEPEEAGRKQPDPRLAAQPRAGQTRRCAVRFPVLPPVEF